jgi:hypothetical protein
MNVHEPKEAQMEKVISYILLIATLMVAWIFGAQFVQFPDSFAKRGHLPGLNEWQG